MAAGADLTVAQAWSFARLQSRCGAVCVPVVVLFAFAVFACVKSLFVVVFGYTQSLLERFATHFLLLPLI